jgi:hypothetical protein
MGLLDQFMTTQKAPALLGSGMTRQAADTLGMRGYQLHVQEAKAMGEQPMTLAQWQQQKTGK